MGDKSKKVKALFAGLFGGSAAGTLDTCLTNNGMTDSIANRLTDVGFQDVNVNNGVVNYLGIDPDKATPIYEGGYMQLNTPLNFVDKIAAAGVPVYIADASLLAAPAYMKKHPEWFIPHVMAVMGMHAGYQNSMIKMDNTQIHSDSLDQTWSLSEFLKRQGISDTNPVVKAVVEFLPHVVGGFCALLGYKLGMRSYNKNLEKMTTANQLPSQSIVYK